MNPLKGLAALIIEPHPGMRASLHNMLSLCGLSRIEDAASSSQAIRALGGRSYDLILCEYELEGGQDGQQMLEDLRHHRLMHASTLFFMVTSEGQFNKVVSAAELAPSDYILKPFTVENLTERITRAIERRNALLPVYQLMDMGDQREAIAACLAGATAQPRYRCDFLRLRAELHLFLGEPEQAEPLYAALWESKRIHWARLGLAKCLSLRGEHEAARAILEELLGQNRRFLDAYDWLARTLQEQGEIERAQAVLSDAVELSPHAVRRLRRLGEVALEAGDVEAAERALKLVVSKTRYSEFRTPEDHARLVQSLVRKGDPVQAAAVIRDLDKSMGSRRNGPLCSSIAAAMLHEFTGNAARLETALDSALAGCRTASGLSSELKLALVRTCLDAGQAERAADVMRDVMRNAANPAAMAKAMRVLEQAGHGELAQRLAQECRQEVGDLVAAGAARAKEGDFRGAVNLMIEAVDKLPDNPQVVFNAAVAVLKCLENLGWDERLGGQARELIGSVRRLDPVNAKLHALAALHHDILKKYNIRPGARRAAPQMAAI
ncbi:response regulator [Massilia sp. MB5]|uniref:tetratricopeptide repeat protein n=1 Tax=unclassified Massilia TaxID=2609279 RepID=UPI00067E17A2|nr:MULTISPECIES: tetratricopeptide repeat protein [unclassified Massilia]AKU22946.1 FimV domain-containing protein [Massilia sp. NR 4-1]UMR32198.1 response regulator [Massilia sp. MB5]